jgi:hypothetical protein
MPRRTEDHVGNAAVDPLCHERVSKGLNIGSHRVRTATRLVCAAVSWTHQTIPGRDDVA